VHKACPRLEQVRERSLIVDDTSTLRLIRKIDSRDAALATNDTVRRERLASEHDRLEYGDEYDREQNSDDSGLRRRPLGPAEAGALDA